MTSRSKVLITGASGLLAHEFILKYHAEYEIFALTHSLVDNPVANVVYVDCDFSKSWNVEILPREVDFIIHLAQSPKFRDFPNAAVEVFNVNLLSTMKLLDYAVNAKVKKFILASSGGIYRESSYPLTTNSEILSPTGLGHYFGSKLSAEIFANNYKEYFAVDINRIFFMYGPRQSNAMLIPRLIHSVKNGKAIQLAGIEGISINPVYVQDVANYLRIQLNDSSSHVYNIAGPEIISIRRLAELIKGQFGGTLNFELLPESANIVANADEFLKKMKYPLATVSEGLSKF